MSHPNSLEEYRTLKSTCGFSPDASPLTSTRACQPILHSPTQSVLRGNDLTFHHQSPSLAPYDHGDDQSLLQRIESLNTHSAVVSSCDSIMPFGGEHHPLDSVQSSISLCCSSPTCSDAHTHMDAPTGVLTMHTNGTQPECDVTCRASHRRNVSLRTRRSLTQAAQQRSRLRAHSVTMDGETHPIAATSHTVGMATATADVALLWGGRDWPDEDVCVSGALGEPDGVLAGGVGLTAEEQAAVGSVDSLAMCVSHPADSIQPNKPSQPLSWERHASAVPPTHPPSLSVCPTTAPRLAEPTDTPHLAPDAAEAAAAAGAAEVSLRADTAPLDIVPLDVVAVDCHPACVPCAMEAVPAAPAPALTDSARHRRSRSSVPLLRESDPLRAMGHFLLCSTGKTGANEDWVLGELGEGGEDGGDELALSRRDEDADADTASEDADVEAVDVRGEGLTALASGSLELGSVASEAQAAGSASGSACECACTYACTYGCACGWAAAAPPSSRGHAPDHPIEHEHDDGHGHGHSLATEADTEHEHEHERVVAVSANTLPLPSTTRAWSVHTALTLALHTHTPTDAEAHDTPALHLTPHTASLPARDCAVCTVCVAARRSHAQQPRSCTACTHPPSTLLAVCDCACPQCLTPCSGDCLAACLPLPTTHAHTHTHTHARSAALSSAAAPPPHMSTLSLPRAAPSLPAMLLPPIAPPLPARVPLSATERVPTDADGDALDADHPDTHDTDAHDPDRASSATDRCPDAPDPFPASASMPLLPSAAHAGPSADTSTPVSALALPDVVAPAASGLSGASAAPSAESALDTSTAATVRAAGEPSLDGDFFRARARVSRAHASLPSALSLSRTATRTDTDSHALEESLPSAPVPGPHTPVAAPLPVPPATSSLTVRTDTRCVVGSAPQPATAAFTPLSRGWHALTTISPQLHERRVLSPAQTPSLLPATTLPHAPLSLTALPPALARSHDALTASPRAPASHLRPPSAPAGTARPLAQAHSPAQPHSQPLLPIDPLPRTRTSSFASTTAPQHVCARHSHTLLHHHHHHHHLAIEAASHSLSSQPPPSVPTSRTCFVRSAPLLPAPAPSPPLPKVHYLFLGMVGLPARGKSFLASKLCRYLRWLRYESRLFSVSSGFKAPDTVPAADAVANADCATAAGSVSSRPASEAGAAAPSSRASEDAERSQWARDARLRMVFDDIVNALREGAKIIVFDAANINPERRDVFRDFLARLRVPYSLMWVESAVNDPELLQANVEATARYSPDYSHIPHDAALRAIEARIQSFLPHYVPLSEAELRGRPLECYMRIVDCRQTESVHVKGYLLTKIVMFLLNMLIAKTNPVFLSRHGQSLANTFNQVGTDAPLSCSGAAYAEALAAWLDQHPALNGPSVREVHVYCSTLQRTIATAERVHARLSQRVAVRVVKWRALAEISAGIYDGLTYQEIEDQDPGGAAERALDKLNYQYPQGESYKDVIDRVERVIMEIMRCDCPIVIIAHQAVIRCVYGYLMDIDMTRIPHLSVPLHHVLTVLPHAYGAEQRVTDIMRWAAEERTGTPTQLTANTTTITAAAAPAPRATGTSIGE